ncbi:DMT family transporter [Kocuria sp.]|uniref:DMT family transporter n=1 Tax=Kocuria sp. TaxID=1871328 RepID=UPI0026E0C3C6|nr:DMT family transporter [Kocuria sp.]MDO5618808.1 DMT family transporter [Kocuria sp.]
MLWIAVGLAVLSAVGLACGTHLQSVAVVSRSDGKLSLHQFLHILRSPRWTVGLGLLGFGTVFNVAALSLAPVTVVQPIGVLGLVITTVLHSRHVGIPINAPTWRAIALCVGGATVFVLTAVRVTDPAVAIADRASDVVTYLLAGVIVLVLIGMLVLRDQHRALFYLFAAGTLYGFVAVQVKVISVQLRTGTGAWWQNIEYDNLIGLIVAAALGGWLVQSAYAAGPPELVMAGLTVVDPMVGVILGLSVLGEAGANFGPVSALALAASGGVSVSGVRLLSRHHPEVLAKLAAARAPKTGELGIVPGAVKTRPTQQQED